MNDTHPSNQNFRIPAPPTVPWTAGDVGWGLLMSLGLILLLALVSEFVRRLDNPIDPSLVVVFGTALLLIPVWYFTIHKYGASWGDLGLRRFRPTAVGMGCGLMLLFFLANMVYGAILALFDLQIQPDIERLFEGSSLPGLLFFGGVIVAPLVEEIVFRGFVFPGLSRRWDWRVGLVGSAFLFALAHIILTSILPIFILGVIFAFLYQLSGSIWPAILMHMLTNSLALSLAYAISQGWVPPP